MKTRLALVGVASAVLASSAIAASATPVPPQQSFIVRTAGAPDLTLGLVHTLGGKVTHVYRSALQGFSVRIPASAAPALRLLSGVVGIEAVQAVHVAATETNPPSYGIDRIDQRDLPLSHSYSTRYQGAGVTAYVIDTGIRFSHEEFGGRASSGVDEIDGGKADDCAGHGTHVAGTIGGKTYGVAKAVSLVAVRVLDCDGNGATDGVIAGIDWMVAHHAKGAPAVANMSFGSGASPSVDEAVGRAIADGITVVAAAGNSGNNLLDALLGNSDACNSSPARVPGAITIAASDSSDRKASYSNTGPCVDLFAPGNNITSASYESDTGSAVMSGTSMATPHVTGAAALYLSHYKTWSPKKVQDAIAAAATPGVIANPGNGTPNKLLFVS